MKYERPPYLDPKLKIEETQQLFSSGFVSVPVFETPITPAENFRRVARRDKPLWIPNTLSDIHSLMTQELSAENVRGMQIGPDFRKYATEDYVFTDWFNTSWTWVTSAGGAMLTPGTMLLEDITDWEKVVQFPKLSEWNFEKYAEEFMKNTYNPNKALHINVGQGLTEMLVAILGGYTEGMLALATEPEAVKDYFDRFAEHMIEFFDLIYKLYPIDMITYHDDWGTERDTFFSERMMEELVLEPTKRIVDHVKSKNVFFELHSCGNIERFMPYIADMDIDFLQIQRRAVDIPKMKRMYGDKVGFNVTVEGLFPGDFVPKDELLSMIRNTVDLYGKSGGAYAVLFDREPERIWAAISELYAYSREYYDLERGE